MAIYTKEEIRFVAATDGTNYRSKVFERDSDTANEIERSDLEASKGETVVIANAATHSVDLNSTGISVVQKVYLESDGEVKVSLKDNTAAVNEIQELVIKGSGTNSTAKLFADIESFTVASGDTFEIKNESGANRTVTYILFGTDDV